MIVIVTRADLPPKNRKVPAEQISQHHFIVAERTLQRAELIVFIEKGKVHVLQSKKWPYSKPMSGAQLLQYIAEHVTNE